MVGGFVWQKYAGNDAAIDDAILLELGRVVIEWASLEALFVTDVHSLVTMIDHGKLNFKVPRRFPIDFTSLNKLWIEMSRVVYAIAPPYLHAAESLHVAANKAAEDRNILIHGYLERIPGKSIRLLRMRPDKATDFRFTRVSQYDVTPETLKGTADGIKKVSDHFISLITSRMAHVAMTNKLKGDGS